LVYLLYDGFLHCFCFLAATYEKQTIIITYIQSLKAIGCERDL